MEEKENGALWETHVVMQVVKYLFSSGRVAPLWYWRTSQGEEVDLLIERGGRFIAVECKYAEKVDQSALKGLKALLNTHGKKSLIAGYIAARTPRPYPLDTVSVVPGSFINAYLS